MKRQAFPERDSQVPGLPPVQDYFDAMLYGGKCLEFYSFEVDNTVAVSLVIPTGAKMCVLVAEAGGSPANINRIMRFTEDPATEPTATDGMPIGDNGIVEIKGTSNMEAFSIISTEALTHVCQVQFYGEG
ncbi:MAG TPA: hypothetical protein PJ995_21530 [Cyclobacteriaceae bacterium]|nr:hypothetical protein [Cyclobacteriaceae bacterium]HMX02933.1 hypothetical protein [Cyclobacteriaceae bacterium]